MVCTDRNAPARVFAQPPQGRSATGGKRTRKKDEMVRKPAKSLQRKSGGKSSTTVGGKQKGDASGKKKSGGQGLY